MKAYKAYVGKMCILSPSIMEEDF